jgi:hypothetical protein
MFGLFKSATVTDPRLGKLEHSRGLWRGNIALGDVTVPLALSGSRTAPDLQAVQMAGGVIHDYDAWRAPIQQALFEHYEPYADAMGGGDGEALCIASPADVWPHVRAVFVQITPFDGALTVEIGYESAWDEEHTLGARMRDGRLLELCGSVLAP